MPYLPPLAIYVVGWLLGIGLASVIPLPMWAWFLLAAFGAVGAILLRRKATLCNLAIAVVLIGLGAARWLGAQPTLDKTFIATYNDKGAATIEGFVVDAPDVRDTYVNLRVVVDTIQIENTDTPITVHGLVLVQAPRFPEIGYGDRLRAQGELQSPPVFEDFSYADYLARQGVYSLLRRAMAHTIEEAQPPNFTFQAQRLLFKPLYAFKAHALRAIAEVFPEPQGALLSGILLGVDANIPDSLKDAFRKTGTSHIVAISGFNISIIVKIFASLFRRLFGEKRSIPLTIIAIGLYTLLAGADASVVRAALMGSLVLLANGFKRPSNGLASLAAAAFLMTVYNPGTLWDVGFQLSVAATLGLIMYAEPLTHAATRLLARFTQAETAKWIVDAVGEFSVLTFAAQLTTLPLIAYYFHQVSIISLVANVLVLPVQPQVMILGGVATLGAMLAKPLGWLLYWLAWPFVTFTIVMVELLAKAPLATIPLDRFPVMVVFGMYAALFGLTWLFSREPSQRPQWLSSVSSWASSLGLSVLVIGALAAWNVYLHQPDGKLHVTFLNVGHGDAALIQTPAGRYALIDGGPSPNTLAEVLGRSLPIGARTLDLVVAATRQADSLGGLPGLFDRFSVGQVVMAGESAHSPVPREWVEGLASRSISTLPAQAGQRFDLGEGAILAVVETRTSGVTLRLDYGNASFLFPVGLDAKAATQLATHGQVSPTTVLLAPDHSAKDSLSALFLDAAQPAAIVIAIGDGHNPDEGVLKLFEGRTILRTDQRGAIHFITDGRQLWAEAER